jgi:UDP-N-acetylmuramoyl-tripeptide--D-alanyl-D-alanine ligase
MKLTTEDLLALEPVSLLNFDVCSGKRVKGISTDSRTTKPGEVFFAFRGERFDGHDFLEQVFERGALCAVVEKSDRLGAAANCPLLVVENVIKAYGRLARIYRRKFRIPVLAVAGSNGKTMTKEMIGAVLAKKFRVLKTEKNLNNHIGVPETLFRLREMHEIAVVEVGTNHFGEVEYLCDILEPTHGLITNIGREHLEFFGDLDGVAKAEGELFTRLGTDGVGFLNADDPRLVRLASSLSKRIPYGFRSSNVRVRGSFLGLDKNACARFSARARGKRPFEVQLATPGKQAVGNALAAATVGLTFRVPKAKIREALEKFRSSDKRMEIIRRSGVTIMNDTYNANPDSVAAALETLQAMQCRGKKIAILGDMLELGAAAEAEHRSIGAAVHQYGVDYLLTYGAHSIRTHEASSVKMKFHYDQRNVLSEYAAELLSPGDIVLVKGSRAMKMEDVVTFLLSRLGTSRKSTG